MDVYLVTKNRGKLLAAQNAFAGTSVNLLSVDKDYPEIQAESSLDIARHAALQAARDLRKPAIREDHSLFINALRIPGPYMNYFEKQVSAKTLLDLLSHYKDRSGYFEVATVYSLPSGETKEFAFRVPFTFARKERGTLQGEWNRIIVLDGETRTLAEYPESERLRIWNQNYLAIAKLLTSQKS